MKAMRGKKGALTIEASIAYPIFLVVIVTMLYIMRIVYVHGLIQHAVSQTAKELSMYTYIYQVTGLNEAYGDLQDSVSGRTEQFNEDVGSVVGLYESFSSGDFSGSYEGTTNPAEILKNIGSMMLSEGSAELNNRFFEAVVRPMMEGYIGADSKGNSADSRLKALRVIGGMKGLDLSSSSFFEDGMTVDIVVCYTIDPLFPIDIMPEMNLANRACVRGMSGKSVFERKPGKKETENSVWDQDSDVNRGKEIQKQQHVRNLPDNFPAFSAFDPSSGTATAEMSIDLREDTYQDVSKLAGTIRAECSKIENYETQTREGVTVKKEDIRQKVLIVYIPSTTKDRRIDKSKYEQALEAVREAYPGIRIETREID